MNSKTGGVIPDAANFIYSKEFRNVEQMDQMIIDGYKLIFNREIPMEIRYSLITIECEERIAYRRSEL